MSLEGQSKGLSIIRSFPDSRDSPTGSCNDILFSRSNLSSSLGLLCRDDGRDPPQTGTINCGDGCRDLRDSHYACGLAFMACFLTDLGKIVKLSGWGWIKLRIVGIPEGGGSDSCGSLTRKGSRSRTHTC